jgi:hypothetical protein
MPGAWESWFVTKHLKTLVTSRAPGLGPGCSCLRAWVDPWSLTLVCNLMVHDLPLKKGTTTSEITSLMQ